MRINNLITIITGVCALVAGCSLDSEFEPENGLDGRIPLNINGAISQVHTKATAEGFVDKDAVGLFAVNYSEKNTVAGTLAAEGNQADNVKYVFDESSHKWVPVKSVYYKDANTNVDLYLYYPYQKSISDVNASGFEVRKDQSAAATATELCGYEASDFLWGKAENVTPVESAVSIKLRHKMSAVHVTLVEKDGFDEGEFESLAKSVIVTNTTRKAHINYATGDVTPIGSAQSDGIVMCPQSDGSFRAVVVPQSVSAGTRLFSITIDGVSYGFKQAENVTYTAGKQLNVSINITKKTPAGDYELELADSQIVDWTEDRNTHGGEARQYYVVNVETPGTLGKVIKAAKKNPDRIRNLKVTGKITTKDFYFIRDSMKILEAVNLKEVKVKNADIIIHEGKYSSYVVQYDDVIPYEAFKDNKSICYFSFPERVVRIGESAFEGTHLSGALIVPDDVIVIDPIAFYNSNISSLSFGNKLEEIGASAFSFCSSLSCELHFPESLKIIRSNAFGHCSLSGKLVLPENLEFLGEQAFSYAGQFTGDLIIPERIQSLGQWTFSNCGFIGMLDLGNVQEMAQGCFCENSFTGELIIPEGVVEIPNNCFIKNQFSSVHFPSTLKIIHGFNSNQRIENLVLPEGLITIGSTAFSNCNQLKSVIFPSSIDVIGERAFNECYNISKIQSSAVEPPTIKSNTFEGVAKDNFTVEVPAQSVKRYQAETGWSDFKRIAAHYDFSVSRERMRALNATQSRTYVLRAPANFEWTVESKPDWVTVSPDSGTGKTDVTIAVSEMPRTSETFEVNEGSFNSPNYKNYAGRSGEVVFKLIEKNYTTTFEVEQYDCDLSDGEVKTYQTAKKGNGIDIVFIGDGYDAKDIAKGTFFTNTESGYNAFFDVEPYKTYKDYFNVYAVVSQSDESGIGTVNTIIDTKFGSSFSQNRILAPDPTPCFTWAKKANSSLDLTKSLTILLMNTSTYEGVTMMYGDGSAIACCPVSTDAYPYDFRGIIQHEAGGHGFGKLGDEYIYHNAFIHNCSCNCCDHDMVFNMYKSLGWYKNLSLTSDATQVPWAHLIYNPKYSDFVDMFEGGYMHSRGVYRSEATSCMNNNIPYYSTISRQAIVERIMEYAGETFTLEKFYALDKDNFGTIPSTRSYSKEFSFDQNFVKATGAAPKYMGEHPNIK